MNNKRSITIGICGASGSGKTFLAKKLLESLVRELGVDSVGLLSEDNYYNDQAHLSPEERVLTNYDHPDSMDHALLTHHLHELHAGRPIAVPQYDYKSHTRFPSKTVRMAPARVIIVEGILLFTDAALCREMDLRVFVDAPLDVCILRRAKRDVAERGRTLDSVLQQYQQTVRPMCLQFVLPSRAHADLIVPGDKSCERPVQLIVAALRTLVSSQNTGSSRSSL